LDCIYSLGGERGLFQGIAKEGWVISIPGEFFKDWLETLHGEGEKEGTQKGSG
jgi:hypothetical protein